MVIIKMAKSDVHQTKIEVFETDLVKESSKYFCGRRFIEKDGEWVPARCREKGGKYGTESVTIRVPKLLVPYIKLILLKLEEIEKVRHEILHNFFNTSPDFLNVYGVEKRVSELYEIEEKD